MKYLAGLVMHGPMQAILVIAVSAMLSLAVPPLSYVSGAAVALVALRMGPWRGVLVSGGAAVVVTLFALLASALAAYPNALPAGPAYLLVVWLPVVALATHLRRTVSLERTLALALLFGGATIVAVHAVVGDPAAYWQELFEDLLRRAGQQPEKAAEMQDAFRLMTGAMAAALTLSLLASLFIGRWWQALLYNEGGFQREFHAFRFGRWFGMATMVTALAAMVGGPIAAFAGDLLLVFVVLHMVHGIAVIHGLVQAREASSAWLVAMYALLVTPLLPGTVITLSAVGLADEWFDFRAFFGKKGEDVK